MVFPALKETGPAEACSRGLVVELSVTADVYIVDLDARDILYILVGNKPMPIGWAVCCGNKHLKSIIVLFVGPLTTTIWCP